MFAHLVNSVHILAIVVVLGILVAGLLDADADEGDAHQSGGGTTGNGVGEGTAASLGAILSLGAEGCLGGGRLEQTIGNVLDGDDGGINVGQIAAGHGGFDDILGILDGPAVVDILGEVEGELSLDLDAAIVGWWVEDRAGFSTDDAIFGRRAVFYDAMDLI